MQINRGVVLSVLVVFSLLGCKKREEKLVPGTKVIRPLKTAKDAGISGKIDAKLVQREAKSVPKAKSAGPPQWVARVPKEHPSALCIHEGWSSAGVIWLSFIPLQDEATGKVIYSWPEDGWRSNWDPNNGFCFEFLGQPPGVRMFLFHDAPSEDESEGEPVQSWNFNDYTMIRGLTPEARKFIRVHRGNYYIGIVLENDQLKPWGNLPN